MNDRPPFLLFPFKNVIDDPALKQQGPGFRKQLVTEIHPDGETHPGRSYWQTPTEGQKCQVLQMNDTEVSVFNHRAPQDRHYHKMGTEMYILVEGEMTICIEGRDYHMEAGDMVVINPGTVHKVQPASKPFLCRVINVNCGGKADKYVV